MATASPAKAHASTLSTCPPIPPVRCISAIAAARWWATLANLLAKTGHDVTKEYYINDAGAQVTALAWAAYWRYLEAIGTPLSEEDFSHEVPGGLQYRGEYLVPVGEQLAKIYGASLALADRGIAAPEVWFDIVRDFTIDAMLPEIRDDLGALGVTRKYSAPNAPWWPAALPTR